MDFWTNLSSILQIPASIVAVLGINAFQIIQYYRKNQLSSNKPLASSSHNVSVSNWLDSSKKHELDWLDLAMALLIGGIISLIVTFFIVTYLRMCSYFVFR